MSRVTRVSVGAIRIALLSLLLLLAGSQVFAETATPEDAKVVAENWLTVMVDQKGAWSGDDRPEVSGVRPIVSEGLTVGYVVDIQPRGYIVVPVLKEMPPIKAYSDDAYFDLDAGGGVPQLLREVLADRAERFINRYGSLEAVQPATGEPVFVRGEKERWNRLLQNPIDFRRDPGYSKDEKIDSVGPLLTSSWHQGAPYNDFCPEGDGNRTLVGCVSTAASQVMQYHKWPPAGEHTYSYYWGGDDSCEGSSPGGTQFADFTDSFDWDFILDDANVNDPPEYREALAELNYEVAVAFRMDFGACASGAVTSRILNVFPTYFHYSSTIAASYRNLHTPESWFNQVKSEITAGRPMVYRIVGHAFVCDGWRTLMGQDQYHMNYGWDDEHTAWYNIDNLYDSEDLMSEGLYRNIIPLRDNWPGDLDPVLADGGSAQASCWLDLDGDDDADQLLINDTGVVLMRNDGTGAFTDASDLLPAGLTAGRAASAADVDGDGDLDIYLVRNGQPNVLLRNDGTGFVDATSGLLADAGAGTSTGWIDADLDGKLDLLIANSDGATHSNRLLRNLGNLQFEDFTPPAMAAQLDTRSVSWCDYDNDGDTDLYLTAYNQANVLLQNDGQGGFTDVTTGALGDTGAGTGAAWGDLHNDGDADLYIVNQGANVLLQNDGGVFTDITSGYVGDTGDGTNATWFDENNDGHTDIYLCNLGGSNHLLRNNGSGTLTSVYQSLVGGGSNTVSSSIVDYDNDGDLDIYLLESGNNVLLRNELWVHNHLQVKLAGSISNLGGVGARLRVLTEDFTLTRWVGNNQGSGNQGDISAHFGLGWFSEIESLEVTWPTGRIDTYTGLAHGQTLEISESPFTTVDSGPQSDSGNARGVSWIDYDQDGDQDLYVVNHGSANRLLRNEGDGEFTQMDNGLSDPGNGNGAAWVDFDSDGDLDVYLTNEGEDNVLLSNDGTGQFSPAILVGMQPDVTSFGATWTDFNNDGLMDLYVVNHEESNNLYKAVGDIGGPWLFLIESGATADLGAGSIGVWGDYNGDSQPDLYLARAADTDMLLANGGLGFEDRTGIDMPTYYGTSRGAAWADYDNDGDLDLYIANEGQADRLLRNTDGYMVEVTGGALGNNGNGRNVAWADYDNDGDLDIYVTRYNQPDLLLRNDGDSVFSHVLTTLGTSGSLTSGMGWADHDGDGLLDIYLAVDGINELQTNKVQTNNHWLHIDLTATGGNTGAIGSRVRAVIGDESQLRVLSAGSGYMSMDSPTVEFGLGAATSLDSLIINWPDGEVQVRTNVSGDRKISITQGQIGSPVPDADLIPVAFGLKPAYPNPFNPSTKVSFDLPVSRKVRVSVYSIDGARVATLVDEARPAGRHEVLWNGCNDNGQSVASGAYFFRMTAGDFVMTRKAVLVK